MQVRRLSESLASKGRQNKGRLVNLLAVVPAQRLLLFSRPAAERLLEVEVGVLAADHEANLAGWVGGDGSVRILDVGEDFLASLLEVDDKGHVEPLVLSCIVTTLAAGHKKHLFGTLKSLKKGGNRLMG